MSANPQMLDGVVLNVCCQMNREITPKNIGNKPKQGRQRNSLPGKGYLRAHTMYQRAIRAIQARKVLDEELLLPPPPPPSYQPPTPPPRSVDREPKMPFHLATTRRPRFETRTIVPAFPRRPLSVSLASTVSSARAHPPISPTSPRSSWRPVRREVARDPPPPSRAWRRRPRGRLR